MEKPRAAPAVHFSWIWPVFCSELARRHYLLSRALSRAFQSDIITAEVSHAANSAINGARVRLRCTARCAIGRQPAAEAPNTLHSPDYCYFCERDANGRIQRSSSVRRQFQRQYPCSSTGLPARPYNQFAPREVWKRTPGTLFGALHISRLGSFGRRRISQCGSAVPKYLRITTESSWDPKRLQQSPLTPVTLSTVADARHGIQTASTIFSASILPMLSLRV